MQGWTRGWRRIDPSDVVQEVLLDAQRELPAYIRDRPVPFFVWLRDIARDRLVWFTRRHTAKKRDAFRDLPLGVSPSGARAQTPVDRLVDGGTSPSGLAIREEERALALALLGRLEAADRRVLELRYLEGLPIAAIAAVLEISPSAAQMRHFRALERSPRTARCPWRGVKRMNGPGIGADEPATSEADRSLSGWAAELVDRISAGEPVDLDALAVEHPGGVERVRRLIPAMAMMARLRTSADSDPGNGTVRRSVPGRCAAAC